MPIKGAMGAMKMEGRTAHAMGVDPDGGKTIMEAFPPRTDRRKGRQETLDLRDERGMSSGNRERNSAIAGT